MKAFTRVLTINVHLLFVDDADGRLAFERREAIDPDTTVGPDIIRQRVLQNNSDKYT
jgi:hypothetical protein